MSTKPFDNTFLRVFSVSQIFNPEGGDENLLEANKNGFMRKSTYRLVNGMARYHTRTL